MSEEDSHQNPPPLLKNKEDAERKFGCPCGKWYLSYPALFTHVKQKHEGKAPGPLIKPKTDKARGRPRLMAAVNEQDASIHAYDCVEELQKVLEAKSIIYEGEYQISAGNQTCQDMCSHFLRIFGGEGQQRKIIICFLNYIRFFVKKRYEDEDNFWETKKPTDIIDFSNEMVREFDNYKQTFPIEKNTLVDMLYVLFRWMYKNKWTDHKLVRRPPQQEIINDIL